MLIGVVMNSETKNFLLKRCPNYPLPGEPSKREIENIEFDGIDYADMHDFCDAYIVSATWSDTGKNLTEEEIEAIPSGHVYEYLISYLY